MTLMYSSYQPHNVQNHRYIRPVNLPSSCPGTDTNTKGSLPMAGDVSDQLPDVGVPAVGAAA